MPCVPRSYTRHQAAVFSMSFDDWTVVRHLQRLSNKWFPLLWAHGRIWRNSLLIFSGWNVFSIRFLLLWLSVAACRSPPIYASSVIFRLHTLRQEWFHVSWLPFSNINLEILTLTVLVILIIECLAFLCTTKTHEDRAQTSLKPFWIRTLLVILF